MGKTYIVTPDYTTRAPPYPWTELSAFWPGGPAEREFEDENKQEPILGTADNTLGQAEDFASGENAANEDRELAEPTEVEADLAPAMIGLAQDVQAAAQSTAVSPALFLGDILSDPLGDEIVALNRKDRMNIPSDDINVPDVKMGFSATRGDLLSGRFGLWATMFAAVGLSAGIETGMFLERRSKDIISAQALVTFDFVATQQFVEDTIQLPSIQGYLANCDKEALPTLYMVTGIKVAYGATLQKVHSQEGTGSIGMQIPGADTQKIIEFKKARNRSESFANSTPFVLAFRVREILYKKGQWQHKLYHKGASMMDGTKTINPQRIEASGLGKGYTIDNTLDEGLDFSLFQDGDDEWLIPGDF